MAGEVRTSSDIREELSRNGITVSAWARNMGFSAGLVYQVLAGRLKCEHGQAHKIAVTLGLKEGELGDIKDLSFGNKEVQKQQNLNK